MRSSSTRKLVDNQSFHTLLTGTTQVSRPNGLIWLAKTQLSWVSPGRKAELIQAHITSSGLKCRMHKDGLITLKLRRSLLLIYRHSLRLLSYKQLESKCRYRFRNQMIVAQRSINMKSWFKLKMGNSWNCQPFATDNNRKRLRIKNTHALLTCYSWLRHPYCSSIMI